MYIAGVASKQETVFYDDPTAQLSAEGQPTDKYRVILPIPPTLY